MHSTTPKENTPVPSSPPVAAAETREDGQGINEGEETQQVQLVVADVEETLDSESEEKEEKDKGT